jgi:hypothetical protein
VLPSQPQETVALLHKPYIEFVPEGWRLRVILRPTYTVNATRQELEQTGCLSMGRFEDDLDLYEAAYLFLDGVAAVIRRYDQTPVGEYSLFMDTDNAVRRGLDVWALSDALLKTLELDLSRIVWRNEELREMLSS